MLLESTFERIRRGAIYNNRRKGVPEVNNVNKKRRFVGSGANIGSKKGPCYGEEGGRDRDLLELASV